MLRPLLHFLWIGVALFAAERWLLADEPARAPVVVSAARVEELRDAFAARAGRPPVEHELAGLVRAEVDDALLVREALRRGFDRDDPVVQRRLIQNMRFAGADPDREPASLYEEALSLGMHESDPVVRRRLVQRMRLLIEARALEPPPTEDALRAHYRANRADYVEPARVRLVQVFFDGTPADEAARALASLRGEGAGADAHRELGEPFLHGAEQPAQSQRELALRFGGTFAAEVFALPTGAWSGPVASSYGEHLVWVRERAAERQRPFDAVREEVARALLVERRRRALDAALAELREGVPVVVAGG